MLLDLQSITLGEAAEAEQMGGPYGATLMGVDFRLPPASAMIALHYIARRREAAATETPAATLRRVLALPFLATEITLTSAVPLDYPGA